MNKLLRNTIIIVFVLGIAAFAASYFIEKETKKNSPQDTVEYIASDLKLKIVYCRPYKKGRIIFGTEEEEALQPYGKYWRLGANEATTIETNVDLVFGNNTLKKGIYSLYAMPGKEVWEFGFNSESNRWGRSEPDYEKDLFSIEVPVSYIKESLEQFKIKITKDEIIFRWDTSEAKLPYKRAE